MCGWPSGVVHEGQKSSSRRCSRHSARDETGAVGNSRTSNRRGNTCCRGAGSRASGPPASGSRGAAAAGSNCRSPGRWAWSSPCGNHIRNCRRQRRNIGAGELDLVARSQHRASGRCCRGRRRILSQADRRQGDSSDQRREPDKRFHSPLHEPSTGRIGMTRATATYVNPHRTGTAGTARTFSRPRRVWPARAACQFHPVSEQIFFGVTAKSFLERANNSYPARMRAAFASGTPISKSLCRKELCHVWKAAVVPCEGHRLGTDAGQLARLDLRRAVGRGDCRSLRAIARTAAADGSDGLDGTGPGGPGVRRAANPRSR